MISRQFLAYFSLGFFFVVTLLAQIFVPFGYWAGRTPLTYSPIGPLYMLTGDLRSFTASGAFNTYTWSITNGAFADGASVGPSLFQSDTGTPIDYIARALPYQPDTITLTSGTSNATISVTTYDAMILSPATVSLAINTTQQFTNSNGYCSGVPGACTNATTTWSIVSGGGSISASGLFTAPATAGTTVIQAADSVGNTDTSTITISSTLAISPATIKIATYSTGIYTAILGTVPYAYSVFAGTGTLGCSSTLTGTHTNVVTTINVTNTTGCPSQGTILVGTEVICYTGTTGTTFTGALRGCNSSTAAAYTAGQTYNSNIKVYTAPSATGSATIRVTDSLGASSDGTVAIIQPSEIVSMYTSVCARHSDGSVKCWGENNNGQLGIGSTTNTHTFNSNLKLGSAVSFVNLGTGRTATKLAAGWYHVCALLDNSTIKCWGNNTYGQLGDTTTTQRTDPSTLSAISFGAKTPNNVWAFGYSSCAGFTDNTTVCWGYNSSGQLGQGNTTSPVTSPPGTMMNLGATRYATKISGGVDFACALLDDSTVKCWGLNTNGEVGDGTTTQRTSPVAVTLGTTAIDIAAGVGGGTGSAPTAPYSGHACAVLTGNTIKCWGYNVANQLGDGTTTARSSPTSTTALGFSPTKVYAGRNSTCASIANSYQTKCWGDGRRGLMLNATTAINTSASVCKTTVTGAHTAAVTTITVGTTAMCPHPTAGTTAPGMVQIGTEIICFTGKTATTFTGATRGCYGTTAAAYVGGEAVNGYMYFGIGIGSASIAMMGRHGCIITGGGTSNNGRIKCWGINTNQGRTTVTGQMLNFSMSATTAYTGDATTELGDNLLFLNY